MYSRSPISEFCEKKGVPLTIRDAFAAYTRAVYADKFMLRHDTDTVRLLVNKLTEEQLENVWVDFVTDLSKVLPVVVVPSTQQPE